MTNELSEKDHAILDLMSSIVGGLKMLGYQGTHFTGLRNPDNGALVLLTISEDEKYHFAIEVRIWQEGPGEPVEAGLFK